jgi:hypothetical protein
MDQPTTLQNLTGFQWTSTRERAALLVAADDIPDESIALELRITRQTLANWKGAPEFCERVNEHRARLRLKVMREGFAQKAERVKALNAVATALLTQIGQAEYQAVIGLTEDGEPIKGFDRGRVREFRGLLDDIAKELGERKQVVRTEGADGEPLPVFLIAGVDAESV